MSKNKGTLGGKVKDNMTKIIFLIVALSNCSLIDSATSVAKSYVEYEKTKVSIKMQEKANKELDEINKLLAKREEEVSSYKKRIKDLEKRIIETSDPSHKLILKNQKRTSLSETQVNDILGKMNGR